MKTLLVITTANQFEFNEAAVSSIQECDTPGVDVCVIDDCSTDGTPEHFEKLGLRVEKKTSAAGLTDSWNRAYRIFKEEGYDVLILANNDILVPKGAVEELLKCMTDQIMVGSMSTEKGVGHQPAQYVGNHLDLDIDDTDPSLYQDVQDRLLASDLDSLHEIEFVNGFFFAVNRDIINYEFDTDHLFDPDNVNVGNEDDLCSRMPNEKKFVCTRSFVYHFKGVTFELSNIDDQDYDTNVNRNMLWSKAEELQNSSTKRLVYKIMRKIKH